MDTEINFEEPENIGERVQCLSVCIWNISKLAGRTYVDVSDSLLGTIIDEEEADMARQYFNKEMGELLNDHLQSKDRNKV